MHSLVYSMTVKVSYGEKDQQVHMQEEEFTITCSFGPKGTDDSPQQNIVEG